MAQSLRQVTLAFIAKAQTYGHHPITFQIATRGATTVHLLN